MTIDVRADAFLRGMVRRIVATLLAVGRGQLEASAVPGLLDGRETGPGWRRGAGPGALPPARRPRTTDDRTTTSDKDTGHED